MRLACIVALLALGIEAQAAKLPRVPPGTWAIDYSQEYCVLSRDGLPGELSVAFRTRPLSDEHDLLFYMLPKGWKEASFKGRLHRADGTPGADRWAFVEKTSGPRQTFVGTTISGDELLEALRISSVRFTAANGLDLRASFPNVGKALAALRECEADLARRWGIEPQETTSWLKPAKAKSDLRELFWGKDPSRYGILRSRHVRAVLDIDEAGAPVACKIVETSRIRWVDTKVCDTLLKQAVFQPALDASGKPVRGKVVTPRITSIRLR